MIIVILFLIGAYGAWMLFEGILLFLLGFLELIRQTFR